MWVEDLSRHEARAWVMFNLRQKFDDQLVMISRIGRYDYIEPVYLAPCDRDTDPLAPLHIAPEDETPRRKIIRLHVNDALAAFQPRRPNAGA